MVAADDYHTSEKKKAKLYKNLTAGPNRLN